MMLSTYLGTYWIFGSPLFVGFLFKFCPIFLKMGCSSIIDIYESFTGELFQISSPSTWIFFVLLMIILINKILNFNVVQFVNFLCKVYDNCQDY